MPPATSAPPVSSAYLAIAAMTPLTQSSTDVGDEVLATVPMVESAPSFEAAVVLHAETFRAVAMAASYFCALKPVSRPIGCMEMMTWWPVAPVTSILSLRFSFIAGSQTISRFSVALGRANPTEAST